MDRNDLMLKYGVMLRKRKKDDQKIRFLTALENELRELGFGGALYQTVYKKRKSVSLYTDTMKTAKTIIITHYDNPDWIPFSRTMSPFHELKLRRRNFWGLTLMTVCILIMGALFYSFVAKPQFNDGVYTFLDVLCYGLFAGLLAVSVYVSRGIEMSQSFSNNTSSIITMLEIARKLNGRKDVAFVFVDSGNSDRFGYLTFKDTVIKCGLKSKIIALDMAGTHQTCVNDSRFDAPVLMSISDHVDCVAGVYDVESLTQSIKSMPSEESINEAVSAVMKLI